jgi:hypothetical protein
VAIYDGSTSWWSGLQVAATNLFSALVAGLMAWLAVRRKVSSDRHAMAQDDLQGDFMSLMLAQHKEAIQTAREAVFKRIDDAGTIAGQAALIGSYKERLESCEEAAIKSANRMAEAEEHARGLTDELLASHMRADQIMAALVKADGEAAQEFLRLYPKPQPRRPTGAPL